MRCGWDSSGNPRRLQSKPPERGKMDGGPDRFPLPVHSCCQDHVATPITRGFGITPLRQRNKSQMSFYSMIPYFKKI
jgi:hypothetical protein